MKTDEQKESERLDGKTVFSASHAEIAETRITQCVEHSWRKLDDENLACTKCPTAIKVDPKTINEYL
jgi:hypothetical protein